MPAYIAKPVWPVLRPSHRLARGLVGAWLFYEGSGKTANDLSYNFPKLTGTLSGSTLPAWVGGSTGWWQSYNGTTAYILLFANTAPASVPAQLGNLASAGSAYTFVARVKTTASASIGGGAPWACGNTIIEARNTGGVSGHAWSFGMDGGKLCTARSSGIQSAIGGQHVVSTTSINDGVEHIVAAVVNANSVSLYIDGKLDATGIFLVGNNATGDCSVSTQSTNVYAQIGARTTNAAAAANWWSGTLEHLMVWNRALSSDEIVSLGFDPFDMFRFDTTIRPETFGGSVYNVSVTESLTLLETIGNVQTSGQTISETLTLVDTPSGVLTTSQTVAEVLSLVDTDSAGSDYAVTIVESVTLLETASDVLTTPQTVAETITLSDAPSTVFTTSQTVAEIVTLSDAPSAAATSPQIVTETLTLADTSSTAATIADSISESLSLADTPSAVATSSQTVAETLTLADTSSAGNITSDAVAESVTLSDTSSASLTSSQTVAEVLSLRDALSAILVAAASVDESLTLVDTPVAVATWVLSVAEALSLGDVLDTSLTLSVDVLEALSLDDTILGVVIQALGFDFVFLVRDSVSVSVLHLEILESSMLKGEGLEVTSLVSETLAW